MAATSPASRKPNRRFPVSLAAMLCTALVSPALPARPEAAPDATKIARRADAVMRSDTTSMAVRMTVKSPRLSAPRVVAFHSWDDKRGDRSFIRILAPAKDAGTGFLRLPPNL